MSKYTIYISLTVALVLSVIVSVFALPRVPWALRSCTYCLGYDTAIWSISYYRPSFSGSLYPWQTRYNWWRNFWSETFDAFTPEQCQTVTVTGRPNDIFIPTRSLAEWNSFKNANVWWVTLSACSTGPGCDINSGLVCWYVCKPWEICTSAWSEYSTFANECEAIAWWAYNSIALWACNS